MSLRGLETFLDNVCSAWIGGETAKATFRLQRGHWYHWSQLPSLSRTQAPSAIMVAFKHLQQWTPMFAIVTKLGCEGNVPQKFRAQEGREFLENARI
jgi:hypothetical protein